MQRGLGGKHGVGTLRWACVVAASAASLASSPLWAQSPEARISELERKLEQSLQQIDNLTKRLQQLESGRTEAPPASAAAAAAQTLPDPHDHDAPVATTNAGGVPLHGFADVLVSRSSNPVQPGARSTFSLGTLDLYLTPQLSDRVKMVMEIALEYDQTQTLGVDIERFQLGYTYSDALTAWVGRFHTPYGYWNTAFHHGAQIQTSILRPRFLDFEDKGGVLPAHTVGLLGSGSFRLPRGRLIYDAYGGNSARIAAGTLTPNNTRADDPSPSYGGKVGYQPGGALSGLTVGAHAYSSKVGAYDAANVLLNRSQVRVYGGYLVYDENDWEILAENYQFRNKDLTNDTGTFGSRAYYGQIGKLVGFKTTPFVRYEKASLNQADNYFASQTNGTSYTRTAFGLRYDLDPVSALKLEYASTKEPGLAVPKSHRIMGQFAVRF